MIRFQDLFHICAVRCEDFKQALGKLTRNVCGK